MNWYSQAGQDRWVFGLTGAGGYFVEVGAHDGVTHSNTYALERHHGWRGVCIEPNVEAFAQCARSRALCVFAAATSIPGPVAFNHDHVVPDATDATGIEVPGNTLDNILEAAGAPDTIDYLSIDVEGHELQVLAGIDFDRWNVRLITVEHNLYARGPFHKDAIYLSLSSLGFERTVEDVVAPGYGPCEDWYQARDFNGRT